MHIERVGMLSQRLRLTAPRLPTKLTSQRIETMINRETLTALYLEWVNDYASLETFAEHKGLTQHEALILLEVSKSCFENLHPEA
jgi:hypothetical protein